MRRVSATHPWAAPKVGRPFFLNIDFNRSNEIFYHGIMRQYPVTGIVLAFLLPFFILQMKNESAGQNAVKGRVTDNQNLPLAGATVYLPELSKGTVAGENGEYFLHDLPDGIIKIQYSFMGYKMKMLSIAIQRSVEQLDVILEPAVIESQEVVVTGGYVTSQHDNMVKIEVMKAKDLWKSGSPSLMESLTGVPGIDMISKGHGIAKPVIRGLSMNDVLVMVNGVRVENYQYGENHPLGVDDQDVERVEIIKGPASLLYGSDAIGGVVNFIKEKPAPEGRLTGDFRSQFHSNTLGISNSLGVKGTSKKLFGGIRAGHKSHADYLQANKEYVPNTRFNEQNLHVDAGYSGRKGTMKLMYDHFKQDLGLGIPAAIQAVSARGRKNDIWYQDLNHQLLSSQNTLFLGKVKWDFGIAGQKALRRQQATDEVPNVEMNLKTLTYESKVYMPVGKRSEYITGIQGMVQRYRNMNDRASQFLPDANVHSLGLLGLMKHEFSEVMTMQAGLRIDQFQIESFAMGKEGDADFKSAIAKRFSNLTGSFGITYRPMEEMMIRSNFAKGYRVPNLSELTSNGIHANRYEIGNKDLQPQKSFESDLSMHYHGEYISFDLAGFINRINNYIFISPTGNKHASGAAIYQFSQTDANLFGGEAGIHFHPPQLAWLHLSGTFSAVTGRQKNNDYLPFIPADKIRVEIRATGMQWGVLRRPMLEVSSQTAFRHLKPSPFETMTAGYTLFNVNLSSEFKCGGQSIVGGLTINNILDTKYQDHLSTLKPLNYLNPGRNASLYLKIPFRVM